jgi:3-deoxy-7-phosphoheptulonate synthase
MYRGDIVNGIGFDAAARRPDPERMFRAYAQSAATLSHSRASAGPEPFYTSHEACFSPTSRLWSAATAPAGTAARPISCGSATAPASRLGPCRASARPHQPDRDQMRPSLGPALLCACSTAQPGREPGRITLISRMGTPDRRRCRPCSAPSPPEGHPVLWSCDPMHGNTMRAGAATRPGRSAILGELDAFFAICRAEGVRPGGIHVEMTGRDVTECTGGASR